MSYEAPDLSPIDSAALRELEQRAPRTTPSDIRAALVRAAIALERRERGASDAGAILEEALALRVSQMDSQSRATEIDGKVKAAMRSALLALRA